MATTRGPPCIESVAGVPPFGLSAEQGVSQQRFLIGAQIPDATTLVVPQRLQTGERVPFRPNIWITQGQIAISPVDSNTWSAAFSPQLDVWDVDVFGGSVARPGVWSVTSNAVARTCSSPGDYSTTLLGKC